MRSLVEIVVFDVWYGKTIRDTVDDVECKNRISSVIEK